MCTDGHKMKKMHAIMVVLSSILVVTNDAGATSVMDRCHPSDNAALIAISAELGNYFDNWITSDYPCCKWYHITCDRSTGRVADLSIFQDDNVTGTIPDAVAGLTHLSTLMLHHLPGISGPIPRGIAKLSNLSLLIISWTGVSGPVPSFLGALKSLTFLDLSFNSLTGTIPASLAGIPNLSGINLSRNRLTGPIPPLLLSKTTDQSWLRLSHNNLSGSIPAVFAAVNFAKVDLSHNAFTGDASALFGRAKPLQGLDLSRNAFSFNLSGVELPERLTGMDVSHNAIYSGILAQVVNMTNLQGFNVSYNRLCGEVPTGGNMAKFDAYSFQHNKCLCGTPLSPCK